MCSFFWTERHLLQLLMLWSHPSWTIVTYSTWSYLWRQFGKTICTEQVVQGVYQRNHPMLQELHIFQLFSRHPVEIDFNLSSRMQCGNRVSKHYFLQHKLAQPPIRKGLHFFTICHLDVATREWVFACHPGLPTQFHLFKSFIDCVRWSLLGELLLDHLAGPLSAVA